MSIFNKVGKSIKKGSKKFNKTASNLGKKYVESKEKEFYHVDKMIEGKQKAKQHTKQIKDGLNDGVNYYNKASNTYDNAMKYAHSKVRGIPVVGKSMDEAFYVADFALNPVSQGKNVMDTVSGKQTLLDGIKNEYAGEAVLIEDTIKRNTRKNKNSKTIEKDKGFSKKDLMKAVIQNTFV